MKSSGGTDILVCVEKMGEPLFVPTGCEKGRDKSRPYGIKQVIYYHLNSQIKHYKTT